MNTITLQPTFFDDEKIRLLEASENGDTYIVIWLKLLCLAKKINNDGKVYLKPGTAYTDNQFSILFSRSENDVHEALALFELFGLINISDTELEITDWANYVSQTKEKKTERITFSENDTGKSESIKHIIDAWNTLSSSGIKEVRSMLPSSKRYKMLSARIGDIGEERILQAIEKVRESDFLCGKVTEFMITFDWFVGPSNMQKILEGNYENRRGKEKKANTAVATWLDMQH